MYATDLRDAKKLDLNQTFEISIEATLDKDGKLVKPTVATKSGDEILTDLAKELVSAMNDSGVLYYLKIVKNDKPDGKITFTIKQNGRQVLAEVDTEASSPEKAQEIERKFALMLWAGAGSRKDKPEGLLMTNTKVSSEGNKVIFKLSMAHEEVVKMVEKGMEITPSPTPLD